MKKVCIAFLLLVAVFSLFSVTAFAAPLTEPDAVEYYDEDGNNITVDGMYYNGQGLPCFNENCYYYGGDGNPVYVGGCRAYCYDASGDFVPCRYYYDTEGNPVAPPARPMPGYGRGGGCCGGRGGRWR